MSEEDEKYFKDEYDKYDVEQDKVVHSSHSGKGRSKKEVDQHHHPDPSGHTRKNVQKLVNNAHNQRDPPKQ